MAFTVLRGTDRLELKVVLGDEPKLAREADRTFFEHLGFTAREFVYGDAVSRRVKVGDAAGVIVHYVRPNGPTALAGLETEDWIQEVDGVPLKDYADSLAKLSAIEGDAQRREFVLLVSRGGETAILRVKLK
jgi:serine protease Do